VLKAVQTKFAPIIYIFTSYHSVGYKFLIPKYALYWATFLNSNNITSGSNRGGWGGGLNAGA